MKNIVDLTGKKIVVTGASSGIGRACAVAASELGAKVILMARREDALRETLSRMTGDGHCIVSVDLADPGRVPDAVAEAVNYDGERLDGLIYCAGQTRRASIRMLDYESVDAIMRVNFYSFLEMCKCFSGRKVCGGGSIVAISSTASQSPQKGQIAYASSKAALNAAVCALAGELAPKEIRVNAILPGFIRTQMSEAFFYKAGDSVEVGQYLGIGEPEDVAQMAAYLLSDAAKFITGSLVRVDGGKY